MDFLVSRTDPRPIGGYFTLESSGYKNIGVPHKTLYRRIRQALNFIHFVACIQHYTEAVALKLLGYFGQALSLQQGFTPAEGDSLDAANTKDPLRELERRCQFRFHKYPTPTIVAAGAMKMATLYPQHSSAAGTIDLGML